MALGNQFTRLFSLSLSLSLCLSIFTASLCFAFLHQIVQHNSLHSRQWFLGVALVTILVVVVALVVALNLIKQVEHGHKSLNIAHNSLLTAQNWNNTDVISHNNNIHINKTTERYKQRQRGTTNFTQNPYHENDIEPKFVKFSNKPFFALISLNFPHPHSAFEWRCHNCSCL